MNRNIYIDCTHTYFSGLNTGIQRVVRNIIKNSSSPAFDKNVKMIPVILNNKNYIEVEELPVVSYTSKKISFKNILKKIYVKIREFLTFLPFLQKLLYSPLVTSYLNKTYDLVTSDKKKSVDGEVVIFKKNDILLMLDSTWLDSDFEYLNKLKQDGVKIISVIYDIIPITHSQFCSDDLVTTFKLWFDKIYPIADGFITISKIVEKQLYSYVKSRNLDLSNKNFDHFLLGVDFKKNQFDIANIDRKYKDIFDKQKTYITVSTLEPRKNHKYILDVFDELWEMQLDLSYVIIGRIGWKVDGLLDRIKNHKQLNKKLFLFDNVDDNALVYAYQNSKAMIFASYIEGFGLPIIESLYYNLQVLASDIPTHKEVGGKYVSYFDLSNKENLVDIIRTNNFEKVLDDFKWKNWSESSEQLITRTLKMVKNNEA